MPHAPGRSLIRQTQRSRATLAGLLVLGLLGGGCAHQLQTRPPDGLDYALPEWSPAEASGKDAERLQEAWRGVLAGDAAWAEAQYRKLLRRRPGLIPAETGLAYALMRGGRWEAAAAGFEAVLARRPDYVPALVGAGALATRAGEAERALDLYAAAAAAAPSDRLVSRRVQETKAQVLERRMADAREARSSGDRAAAEQAYRAALEIAPEVGGVRVELADLLHEDGRSDEAVALLRAAPEPEPSVQARLAQILVDLGRLEEALAAYRALLDADPGDAATRRRAEAVRRELELLQMPEPYREIPGKETITRADLAALVAIKVTALGRLREGEPRVVIDVSRSWAEPWILRVTALDIMSVYPNHTFQPEATVRRDELAHAVGRVLDLLEVPEQPAPRLRDISPAHLYHRGATRAVASGLMDVTPAGAFEPWRPVTGAAAVAVIEALARLVGP